MLTPVDVFLKIKDPGEPGYSFNDNGRRPSQQTISGVVYCEIVHVGNDPVYLPAQIVGRRGFAAVHGTNGVQFVERDVIDSILNPVEAAMPEVGGG